VSHHGVFSAACATWSNMSLMWNPVGANMEQLVAKLGYRNNEGCKPGFRSNSQHITFQQDFAIESISRKQ